MKKRHLEVEPEDVRHLEAEEEDARQCFGPACCEAAREGSKYCSDECGMKLATK